MQVVELNQVEQEPIKTVCEQPLEPVPEEAPEQVAEQVAEQVTEQVAPPKPKRKVGRPKDYKPPKAIIEKVYQEERVLEEPQQNADRYT